MPSLKLTAAAVKTLKAPAKGRVEFWDSQLPGFGLRISDSGRRTWQAFYRVDGKMVRETFGTVDQIPDVADARQKARDSMAAASAGKHPVEEKRERQLKAEAAEVGQKNNTLAGVLDRYLRERPRVNLKGKKLSAEYLAEIDRCLRRDICASPLGRKLITEVDAKDIRSLVRELAKTRPAHANHVLKYLRTALQWAVDEDIMTINPAAAVKPPAPRSERDRALEDWEIRLLWNALDNVGCAFGPLDKLLLLTGQRRDELILATWSEFDLDKAEWNLRHTKNGEPHIVHLAQLAITILEQLPRFGGSRSYVFTLDGRTPIASFSGSARRIKAEMQRLADLEGLGEVENFT